LERRVSIKREKRETVNPAQADRRAQVEVGTQMPQGAEEDCRSKELRH